jgi:hypothetical protein
MSVQLDDKIKNLQRDLYPNDMGANIINRNDIQKNVYELLKQCLIEERTEVDIGSYNININPQELSVIYDTGITKIEVSNFDVSFETERQTETKYYVLSEEDKSIYDSNTKYITVQGRVLNYNGTSEELYRIELYSDNPQDDLKQYIKLSNGFTYIEPECTNLGVTICRRVLVDEKKFNVSSLFDPTKVKAVILHNDKFIKSLEANFSLNEDYSRLMPNLNRQKEIISFIYGTIVDFYNDYVKLNN